MTTTALIPVFAGDNDTQLCNARDLHSTLGVGRDFSNWIKGRIEEYSFLAGSDYVTVEVLSSPKSASAKARKQTIIEYHLTLDMAKELAMVENNEQGRMVRRYFIQAEKELRAHLRDMARHVLPIPGAKRISDGMNLRQAFRCQEQSRKIVALILSAKNGGEQRNMHLHLRQLNDALGIPTESLEDIICDGRLHPGRIG